MLRPDRPPLQNRERLLSDGGGGGGDLAAAATEWEATRSAMDLHARMWTNGVNNNNNSGNSVVAKEEKKKDASEDKKEDEDEDVEILGERLHCVARVVVACVLKPAVVTSCSLPSQM